VAIGLWFPPVGRYVGKGIVDEGCWLLGLLEHGRKLLRHKVRGDEDLAIGRREGYQILGGVPGDVHYVRIFVPGQDALVLGGPD
jgi:hypothetical protein